MGFPTAEENRWRDQCEIEVWLPPLDKWNKRYEGREAGTRASALAPALGTPAARLAGDYYMQKRVREILEHVSGDTP